MSIPLANQRSWIVPFIILALTWLGSAAVGYNHNDSTLTNRVTALETQQHADSVNQNERLNRIESKLDRLFYEVTSRSDIKPR